uniref:Uncharacterized protein n=1 Tax=Chromera velia CCMP2878 TaxID=1169474 RepID=A0A0G4GJ33_9ALVE|eukprot:Cvel_22104.t1-p1 / transcript=Cvel_22104.t1 / gene=Cvel_22104 / organism=Chromera_velia_CCMP2878 / gene_product=hypothetical protein / transcript_product=hypothetical protein / location=Cvel_scaffold2140:8483-14020(+) / protein_length=1072 / sequence_SO=supercontig / SO=protein_coding / is_pseudo=false
MQSVSRISVAEDAGVSPDLHLGEKEREKLGVFALCRRNNFLGVIEGLTRTGAHVDEVEPSTGLSLLQLAAEAGFLRMVKVLVSLGADVLLENSLGETAIDLARQRGHPHVVLFLENRLRTGMERKRALLFCNHTTQGRHIPSAVPDCVALVVHLSSLGFLLSLRGNFQTRDMVASFDAFLSTVGPEDLALFYFVGVVSQRGPFSLLHGVDSPFECTVDRTEYLTVERVASHLGKRPVFDLRSRSHVSRSPEQGGAGVIIIDGHSPTAPLHTEMEEPHALPSLPPAVAAAGETRMGNPSASAPVGQVPNPSADLSMASWSPAEFPSAQATRLRSSLGHMVKPDTNLAPPPPGPDLLLGLPDHLASASRWASQMANVAKPNNRTFSPALIFPVQKPSLLAKREVQGKAEGDPEKILSDGRIRVSVVSNPLYEEVKRREAAGQLLGGERDLFLKLMAQSGLVLPLSEGLTPVNAFSAGREKKQAELLRGDVEPLPYQWPASSANFLAELERLRTQAGWEGEPNTETLVAGGHGMEAFPLPAAVKDEGDLLHTLPVPENASNTFSNSMRATFTETFPERSSLYPRSHGAVSAASLPLKPLTSAGINRDRQDSAAKRLAQEDDSLTQHPAYPAVKPLLSDYLRPRTTGLYPPAKRGWGAVVIPLEQRPPCPSRHERQRATRGRTRLAAAIPPGTATLDPLEGPPRGRTGAPAAAVAVGLSRSASQRTMGFTAGAGHTGDVEQVRRRSETRASKHTQSRQSLASEGCASSSSVSASAVSISATFTPGFSGPDLGSLPRVAFLASHSPPEPLDFDTRLTALLAGAAQLASLGAAREPDCAALQIAESFSLPSRSVLSGKFWETVDGSGWLPENRGRRPQRHRGSSSVLAGELAGGGRPKSPRHGILAGVSSPRSKSAPLGASRAPQEKKTVSISVEKDEVAVLRANIAGTISGAGNSLKREFTFADKAAPKSEREYQRDADSRRSPLISPKGAAEAQGGAVLSPSGSRSRQFLLRDRGASSSSAGALSLKGEDSETRTSLQGGELPGGISLFMATLLNAFGRTHSVRYALERTVAEVSG